MNTRVQLLLFKQSLLTILFIATPLIVCAQGQLVFQNNGATAITNSFTGERASTNTRVGLYVNSDPAATAASFGWVHIYTTNLFTPGIFLGGIRNLVASDDSVAFPAGTPIAVQVRAWLGFDSYETYEEAFMNAGAGSALGTSVVIVLTPTQQPNIVPTLVTYGLEPFTIGIPEPSGFALGLLGVGLFALFCRKSR